jgi:hypothetical protein
MSELADLKAQHKEDVAMVRAVAMAVVASILALGSLAFLSGYAKLAAVVFFAAPWIIGAPQSETHGFAHPDADAIAELDGLRAQREEALALAKVFAEAEAKSLAEANKLKAEKD